MISLNAIFSCFAKKIKLRNEKKVESETKERK